MKRLHTRTLLWMLIPLVAILPLSVGRVEATSRLACGGWSFASSPNSTGVINVLNGISVLSATDAWVVGYSEDKHQNRFTLIEHWDGSSWQLVQGLNPSSILNILTGVTALSANNVWAVGYSDGFLFGKIIIEHWNGSSWQLVKGSSPGTGGNSLSAITALAANNIWAIGHSLNNIDDLDHTLVEHWDGLQWKVVKSPNVKATGSDLYGLAAVSATDIWAVGAYFDRNSGQPQTLIEHWNGQVWSIVPSPSLGPRQNYLVGGTALATNNVWAVGLQSTPDDTGLTLVEHWDGSRWSVVPSPSKPALNNTLNGVAALSANDIWAVGTFYLQNHRETRSLIEHWDGQEWSFVAHPNPGSYENILYAVAQIPGTAQSWVVGDEGDRQLHDKTLVELYC